MEISLYRKLLESEEDRLGMATGGKSLFLAEDILAEDILAEDILAEDILAEDIIANDILAKDTLVEDILVSVLTAFHDLLQILLLDLTAADRPFCRNLRTGRQQHTFYVLHST